MLKKDNVKKDKNHNFSRLKSPRPIAFAVSLALASSLFQTSQAATFIVDNTMDDSSQVIIGSLRNAVDLANATAGNDTIQFDAALAGSTITLQNFADLSVGDNTSTDSLTIIGPTAGDMNSITVIAAENRRVMTVASAPASGAILTLENMTLKGGNVDFLSGGALDSNNMEVILNHVQVTDSNAGSGGGGISVDDAGLELNHSVVSNNVTDTGGGGGIEVDNGLVRLNQSIIFGNSTTGASSFGGGVSVFQGNLNLFQTTVTNNKTMENQSDGAGLYVSYGDTEIIDSTISNNKTYGFQADGAGIFSRAGKLTLKQATISGNSIIGTDSRGGGIFSRGDVLMKQSTVTENNNTNSHTSSGMYVLNHTAGTDSVIIHNSVLSRNSSVPNGNLEISAYATVSVDSKNNVFGDSPAEFNTSYNDIFTNSPDFGSLNSNGGLTETHLPNATSPAINKGNVEWIEQFKADGLTAGCDATNFCPEAVVVKEDLAKILLKAKYFGLAFTPMPENGIYDDVLVGSFNADWIEALDTEGITDNGCDANKICPKEAVTIEVFETLLDAAFPL